jgi:FtsP/CotA-like multicopper oxidase with cupredoxin domain
VVGRQDTVDRTVVAHTFDGIPALGTNPGVERLELRPGRLVRLRLVNTDNSLRRFALTGTPFQVVAIDGTDLNEPEPIRDTVLEVAGGGRIDVAFTTPATPVWLSLVDTDAALAINAAGAGLPTTPEELPAFDPAAYGRAAPTPFGEGTDFDRSFELTISQKPGFFDGRPGRQWALNGRIYPDVPTFVVEEGDLIEIAIVNDTDSHHPMHLHGHHVLVLERDGRPVSGSPWWSDTLEVAPGEDYRVAFRADNPGLWMDHCHNLGHAADGLTMHVAYAGVTTPFDVGGQHGNEPE